MRRLLFLLGLFAVFPQLVNSQQKNNKEYAIKFGSGISLFEGRDEFGFGFSLSGGVMMKMIDDEKDRYNLLFSYGRFNNDLVRDMPSQFFNTYALNSSVDHDFFKFQSFSVFGTVGVVFSLSKGTVSSFFDVNNQISHPENQFSNFYISALLGLGLRISPKLSRFEFDINPIQVFLGGGSYQVNMSVSLDYKF